MFNRNKKALLDASEVYKDIVDNIEHFSINDDLHTLLIASYEKGEGKSTVCSNLAHSLSKKGKKVLLIDSDLVNPSLHKRFLIENNIGLTDYFDNKFDLEEVICKININMHVITSGSKVVNDYEMLPTLEMNRLLEDIKGIYDYILIDTASIKVSNDAIDLCSKCDGTIYVVKSNRNKNSSIVQGYNLLKDANANFIGSIINGVIH